MATMLRRSFLLLFVAGAVTACSRGDEPAGAAEPVRQPADLSRTDVAEPQDTRPRIVALGDSLTAGLGLNASEAWPALIQQRLDEEGYAYRVINAGVSGDTTAGGRRRLDWVLGDGDVRVLVLELGANDGLRGLSVDEMKANLAAMIREARSRDIKVLLCGMEAPPNFGPEYTAAFRQAFADLAAEHDVAFLPFFLDGVAGVPSLNQPDGIHPNAEGTRRVAELVWRALEPLLDRSTPTS
jgi:acyl-CoA thioesterase-1